MRSLTGLFVGLLLFTGCAPLDTRYQPVPVVIDVRDSATGEPIEDVAILGSVNVLFNVDMQDNSLGRGGGIPGFVEINEPSGWIVHTDGSGSVATSIAGGNPTSLLIYKEGYPFARGVVETNTTRPFGATGWTEGHVSPAVHGEPLQGTRLQYRVLPAGTR